jgi:hypothetical protein
MSSILVLFYFVCQYQHIFMVTQLKNCISERKSPVEVATQNGF